MSQKDHKTIFDLKEIIERCFEEGKKAGYIQNFTIEEFGGKKTEAMRIVNQTDLVQYISMTIIGELYELELIRRIAPIFRENRALTKDFQEFGEDFQLFFDKAIQDLQLHSLRINEGGA